MTQKEAIRTDKAPAPIGPYNQAIKAGGMLFVSGQVPLHPESGEVTGATVEEQTDLVMKNLEEVLEAGGANFDSVVKTGIFIKNMDDFPKINGVYAKYFEGRVPPARACVEVARLPKDVMVEIEAIAMV
jgi:2-iminobutanoate/2-iminopropanoate deaminase